MNYKIIKKDFTAPFHDEWIDTNGLGGFASSSSAMVNTRRYHGLLCAAIVPASVRTMLVSAVAEYYGETRISPCYLGDKTISGRIDCIKQFMHIPFPCWKVSGEGFEYEKSVFMPYGHNTVIIHYRIIQGDSAQFRFFPELVHRDYHMMYSAEHLDISAMKVDADGFSADWYESGVTLSGHISSGDFRTQFSKRTAYYPVEDERGFEPVEDVFSPGYFTVPAGTQDFYIIFTTEPPQKENYEEIKVHECARRQQIMGGGDSVSQMLRFSAEQFFFKRADNNMSVIAGYPWFTDWGRDTMIALDGLALCNGWHGLCRNVLISFSHYVSRGMIPNRFPDHGDEPEYNTIDATLWFFEACWRYYKYTGDKELLAEFFPVFEEIIQKHCEGTRYNIHVDSDGLLYGGSEGWQLTWMDAKYEQTVFTPRHGKCVEINALWFNALCIMADICRILKKNCKYSEMAESVKKAMGVFNLGSGYCADYINENEINTQLRPNQLFAFSLSSCVFSPEQAAKMIEKCKDSLYTPLGIRSLSPDDKQYCSQYRGNHYTRDSQYHQGTVWCYIMGAYADTLAAAGQSAKIPGLITGLVDHLYEGGLGTVSEICDADAPHMFRGCFSQAWSVAELIRIRQKYCRGNA